MTTSGRRDIWAGGDSYESYIGRWSRLVAREFLLWLAVPSGARWLDVGCGTGALSQTILAVASPLSVHGIDSSEGYVAFARSHVQDMRAEFTVGDAQSLPVESAAYDAVVSGLMLNFLPQPGSALREMIRAVRKDGTVATYVWDYAGQMQLIRFFWDVAAALDPQARQLDEKMRFQLCQPEPLRALFQTAQLGQIEVRPIDIPTTFHNFDDYWMPFLGGQGPAPGYVRSLSEEQRTTLRERLRAALPFAADGTIPLVAHAWAVRGVKES